MDTECVEVYFDFQDDQNDVMYSNYINGCSMVCKTKKYMRCHQCKNICCLIHYNKKITRSSGTKLKLKMNGFHLTQARAFCCFDCSEKSPFMSYKEQIQDRIGQLQCEDNEDVSWMFGRLSFGHVDSEQNKFIYEGHTYDLSSFNPKLQILPTKNGSMVMKLFYNTEMYKTMDWNPLSPYIHYGTVSETNCSTSWDIYEEFLLMQTTYTFHMCELLTELHNTQQNKQLWIEEVKNVKDCNNKQLLFLIHEILGKELTEFNDKEYIFARYVRENKINGEVLVDMERNDFGQNIAYMSGDKKMNGPSIKLYDELRKYKLETLHKESDVWCIDYKRHTTPLQIYDEEYKLELESVKENLDCLIKYDNNGDKVLPITEVQ